MDRRRKNGLEAKVFSVLSDESRKISDGIFKRLKEQEFVDETSVERLYDSVLGDLRNAGVVERDYEPRPSELQELMSEYVLSDKLGRLSDTINFYDKKLFKHFGLFVSFALLGAASYLIRDYLGLVPSAAGVLGASVPAFYHFKQSLDALLNKRACDVSTEIIWFEDNIKPPAPKLDCPSAREPDYPKITDGRNYEMYN